MPDGGSDALPTGLRFMPDGGSDALPTALRFMPDGGSETLPESAVRRIRQAGAVFTHARRLSRGETQYSKFVVSRQVLGARTTSRNTRFGFVLS
jgi:hypothetical protein